MIERKHKVYLQNFVEKNMHILPQPKKIERLNGSFCIDKNCDIHTNPLFLSQANRFAELLLTGALNLYCKSLIVD